jgi:polysaccharide biosynthesis protein PslJ
MLATLRSPGRLLDGRWAVASALLAATVLVAITGVLGAAAALAAVGVAVLAAWLVQGRDATAMLSVGMALMVAVPSRFVVGPFGAPGWPPILVGVFFLTWWAAGRITPGLGTATGINPVRYAIFAMLASLVVSYANAFTTILHPLQTTGADRVAMTYLGYFGFALLAVDGINSLDRFVLLLRRFVYANVYLSISVFLQFRNFGFDLSQLAFPGLTAIRGPFAEIRGEFNRAPGTSAHPIEASVLLAMALPIALTFFFLAEGRTQRRRWGLLCIIIGVALPMTVSRTGVLSIAVAMLVLLPTWPKQWRRYAMIAFPVGVVALRFAVPGLVGTIRGLFQFAGQDSSVAGRTDDYEPVFQMIYTHPWLGIGPGGFLPEVFFFLDNQILLTLLEQGAIGVVVLIAAPTVAATAARLARRRTDDLGLRMLCQAITAAVLGGIASFITFDAMSFPTFGISWFLLMGCCGAVWRLVPAPPPAAASSAAPDVVQSSEPHDADLGSTGADSTGHADGLERLDARAGRAYAQGAST